MQQDKVVDMSWEMRILIKYSR